MWTTGVGYSSGISSSSGSLSASSMWAFCLALTLFFSSSGRKVHWLRKFVNPYGLLVHTMNTIVGVADGKYYLVI